MARASIQDPIKVFRFTVHVDGFLRAGFAEMSGLDRTTEIVNYREGGDNTTVKKSAGLTSFADVTLRRGQIMAGSGPDDFYQWATQVFEVGANGGQAVYRKNIEITQVSHTGVTVRRWRLVEAFVVGYKPFSDLNGQTNENSMEELRIAHEGFELIATP